MLRIQWRYIEMKKRRKFVRRKDDQFQPYQLTLMGVGFFLISLPLLGSLIFNFAKYPILRPLIYLFFILISVAMFGLIALSFGSIILSLMREQVAYIDIPKMDQKSEQIAKNIKKLFTKHKLIEVLNLSNDTKYGHELPEIEAWVNEDLTGGFLAIENIGNYDRLTKSHIEQNISGILTGQFQDMSIISSYLNNGDNYMIYDFEDTVHSMRYFIEDNDLTDFVSSNPHKIQLSKNLTWHTDRTPHLSCIARTRSGKSILMGEYMAALMQLQGWDVEYNSVKLDQYVKKFGGRSTALEIVESAEYWCRFMDKRLKIIHDNGKDNYLEMEDMNNVAIFFDEIGNLNALLEDSKDLSKRWKSSINRLTATGASCGIHVIAISQYGTKEAFLPSTARANCADAVIMLGASADSAVERQFMMPGFADLPHRNFIVGQGLARFNSSGTKWMTPQKYEAPWFKNKSKLFNN